MPAFLDILILAMLAGFLCYRLYMILGRRSGLPPDEVRRPRPALEFPVQLGGTAQTSGPEEAVADSGHVAAVRAVDPDFSPGQFLRGAQIACERVVHALAAGEKELLRPLVSDEVLAGFARVIDERASRGETCEDRVIAMDSADIVASQVDGQTVHVQVRFVTRQLSVIYDADHRVIAGDPLEEHEVTALWTFSRSLDSPDPNWTLTATRSVTS